jgi:hypothetical protein
MKNDGLITRAELAIALGVTQEYVRHKEKLGKVKPEKRGRMNQPLYNKSAIATLQEQIPVKGLGFNRVTYGAEDAKRVFGLIRSGTPLFDIVMELGIHPDVVQSIAYDAANMSGGLFVHGPVMKIINELNLDGNFPLTSDDDLLEVLKSCVSKDCSHCGKHAKSVCKHCVPVLARKLDI